MKITGITIPCDHYIYTYKFIFYSSSSSQDLQLALRPAAKTHSNDIMESLEETHHVEIEQLKIKHHKIKHHKDIQTLQADIK